MDIRAYKRGLYFWQPPPKKLLNWPIRNNKFGPETKELCRFFQKRHGLKIDGIIGPKTYALLYRYIDPYGRLLIQTYILRHKTRSYPLGRKGSIIGIPYVGTHNHPFASDPLHNWESCNAVDIAAPYGTKVLAVRAGTIGPQIGPLDTGDPVLLGLRLHLVTAQNEWYYAHLSKLYVHAGEHVEAGALLGLSGEANGVQHLHLGQRVGDPGVTIGASTPGYHDHHYPG